MKPSSIPAVETLTVDIIEEPVQGVTVVTDIEATQVHEPSAEEPEEGYDSTPPASVGR